MQQAVEDGEVGKETVGEDAVKIKFQVAQLDEARAVAQKAKNPAIGDEAVELFVEIDELLHDGVRRHAEGGVFRFAVKAGWFAVADNLNRGLGAVGGTVRDGVELAIQLRAAGLELDLIAEESEQRNDPLLARFGCGGRIRAQAFRVCAGRCASNPARQPRRGRFRP